MGKKDARIDDYVANSPEFARPILIHLRKLVHTACRKWRRHSNGAIPLLLTKEYSVAWPLLSSIAFSAFGRKKLIFDGKTPAKKSAIPDRITSVAELPSDSILLGYIKEAVRLNEEGIKVPAKPKSKAPKTLEVPAFLTAALKKNKKAQTTFNDFSYSHKKEYVEWLTEAKRPETREQRLATAIQWLAEGKPRNWKYMNC
jgi:hypothetical protein